jgi:hypothetical protein
MDYSLATRRLGHHASAAEVDSFTFALWQAERQAHPPELGKLFDDILVCFEVVNHSLNTEHPSGTINGKADTLERRLVTDVSGILSEGWSYYWRLTSSGQFPTSFLGGLAALLVQIGIAWEAVLAGDIDDIRDHVHTEYSAREYAA